jgi:putative acetyltransferase
MTSFKRTNSHDPGFQQLVVLLDADLKIRDGDEHAFYSQFNTVEHIHHVIVCYQNDQPAGCGAFKEYGPGKAEIKRMFVLPAYRGQGTGLAILKELEQWAASLHYRECILETGKKQPEAISLYRKAGYTITENYGQYKNVENSVCMAKCIV